MIHRTLIALTVVWLALAIAFTIAASFARGKFGWYAALLAVLAMYGVCVGIAAIGLAYFFTLQPWTALALGVPLGVPVLVLAAKSAEA